ncbi:unnamed protein product, partial [Rotaria sordida]
MSIFLCIVAVISIFLNRALVYSFIRYKVLSTSPNIHVMLISIMSLLASCTILPLTDTSSVYCKWLYKRAGCQFNAVIVFFYGCSSSYLLCVVNLSRSFRGKYYVIPSLITFIFTCFTKSSVIWISLLFIGTPTQFKLRFIN